MYKLDRLVLGEGNLKVINSRIIIADNYNDLVDKINELVDSINTQSPSTTIVYEKTITVPISPVDELVVAGSTFTPPITTEPRIVQTSVLGDIVHAVTGWVQSGNYWNIVIAPTNEEITNLKISVL